MASINIYVEKRVPLTSETLRDFHDDMDPERPFKHRDILQYFIPRRWSEELWNDLKTI